MIWQSKSKSLCSVRLAVSVVVIVLFGRTDLPVESNAYLSLSPQADRDVKEPITATNLKGFEWDLTGLAAIDRHNLWVVGNVRGPKESALDGGRGIVLASSDAGQSWAIQRVEEGKYFSAVDFVDRMTGWVSDGSDLILNTTDAGSSWTPQKAPAKSLWCGVQFVDSRRGWVLGVDGKVLRTDDGGLEWKLTKITTSGDLFFLSFADDKRGWLVGEKGSAYETTDSGAHWRSRGDEPSRLLPDGTDSLIDFRMVKFVNSRAGFIAASLSRRAAVFRTVDRGRTWTASIVPEALGIRIATFLTDREAWIVPGGRANTVVRHTQDGGRTWSSLRLPRNSEPAELLFVDSKHGWLLNGSDILNSDKIFSTKDGGKTWVEIRISERIAHS